MLSTKPVPARHIPCLCTAHRPTMRSQIDIRSTNASSREAISTILPAPSTSSVHSSLSVILSCTASPPSVEAKKRKDSAGMRAYLLLIASSLMGTGKGRPDSPVMEGAYGRDPSSGAPIGRLSASGAPPTFLEGVVDFGDGFTTSVNGDSLVAWNRCRRGHNKSGQDGNAVKENSVGLHISRLS